MCILNTCLAWPPKARSPIKIHAHTHTQLGLRGSSRRSNGSGSQTLSPSPGLGSSPCVCDSNFLKNPQQAQHFSFYFYKNTTDPTPLTSLHRRHHTDAHTHNHFWETQSSHLQLQLIQEYDIQSCQIASRPTKEANGHFFHIWSYSVCLSLPCSQTQIHRLQIHLYFIFLIKFKSSIALS